MKTGSQQSSEVRLTCLDFIPRMAEGTNRVRELGPLKSVGGTWVGRWWDGGGESRQMFSVLLSRARRSLSSLLCKVSASSPLSPVPVQSLSRWLSVSWPSMEALPEPTIGAPFPGIWGD